MTAHNALCTTLFGGTIPLALTLIAVVSWSCTPADSTTLFSRTANSGISFANSLTPTEKLNTYVFRNFYNGGGVAIGDINNDGHKDIFLTGNQVSNKLFLNHGDATFYDATATAGLASDGIWTTGVSMADVDGDGWLDIYLCKSGPPGGRRRANELLLNNRDGTFTDKATDYGLNIEGLSIHASFLDYDRDGDLDIYLLSNPARSLDDLQRRPGLRSQRDPGGNKLFRSELIPVAGELAGTVFTDVTEEAGLFSSAIGFGLGVSVSDVNRDGWQDIYVSNDFFERDYLYLNLGTGAFHEVLPDVMGDISLSSMGGDIADINNDGYPEIFISDMLPRAPERLQSKIVFPPWREYAATTNDGYHFQHTRNTLQLNRGPEVASNQIHFSEIGRLAGVDATEWSWGGLFADFDLDSHKDLFVPSGIYKDLLDQDFLSMVANGDTLATMLRSKTTPILNLLSHLPTNPLPNLMFAGSNSWRFDEVGAAWGLSAPSFSNGAAYGDLDSDGDLDLVINNVNSELDVFLNNATDHYPERKWLQVDLRGPFPNTFAVGAQLTAWYNGRLWYAEHQPVRGFQSTADHTIHFAFGATHAGQTLDSLVVMWPDGVKHARTQVAFNQRLMLSRNSDTQ